MSLIRTIYYSGLLAAWGALIAWAFSETFVIDRLPLDVMLTASVVGGAIAFAVSLAGRLAGTSVVRAIVQASPSFLGGAIGGALAGLLGDVAYSFGLPRAVGWLVMGAGIGVVDGIRDSSIAKARNGLIGGALGGLIGGLVFDPVQAFVSSSSGMSSRAIAFVVLGAAIGCGIGLAQVILRDAWLTVVDGYRPGRQIILSREITALGTAEHLPMSFRGPLAAGVAAHHLHIKRLTNGRYSAEPVSQNNQTLLNREAILRPTLLNDGDIIRLGSNIIRFSEKFLGSHRAAEQSIHHEPGAASGQPVVTPTAPPPPPLMRPTPRHAIVAKPQPDLSQNHPNNAPRKTVPPITRQQPASPAKPPPPPPPPPPSR